MVSRFHPRIEAYSFSLRKIASGSAIQGSLNHLLAIEFRGAGTNSRIFDGEIAVGSTPTRIGFFCGSRDVGGGGFLRGEGSSLAGGRWGLLAFESEMSLGLVVPVRFVSIEDYAAGYRSTSRPFCWIWDTLE